MLISEKCATIVKKSKKRKLKLENTVKNDFLNEEILPEEKKHLGVGRIINICLTVALFTFITAFIFRICQSDYKGFEGLSVSSDFKEAYSVSQDVRTHAPGKEFSDNGAVYAYSLVYIPEAEYLQITVRYNARHIDEVVSSLNANERALKGESAKAYTKEDISVFYTLSNNEGKVYTPTLLGSEEKYNYCYFKLEFTGVDFDSAPLNINMMIKNVKEQRVNEKNTLVYASGEEYNSAQLEIHKKDNTFIPYELAKKEKEELK